MSWGPAVALSLFSAGTSLAAGNAASQAAKTEAAGYEYEAKTRDLRAKQISATAREDLNAKLAGIEAIRASRNLAAGTPTGEALNQAIVREAYAAESREVLSERMGAVAARTSSLAAMRRARGNLYGGYANAIGDLGRAFSYLDK